MKLNKYELKKNEREAYRIFASEDIRSYPLWLKKEINADCIIICQHEENKSLGYIRERVGKHRFFYDQDTIVLMENGELKIMVANDFDDCFSERKDDLCV